MPISNFLLTSRAIQTSTAESIGDFLLSPARNLLGGRRVTVFHDGSVNIQEALSGKDIWEKTAAKIVAIILLPLAILGAAIKLLALLDKNYRDFCAQKLPEASNCNPKLFEMFQHVHETENYVSGIPYKIVFQLFGNPHKTEFQPLGLSECACTATGAFNRFYSPRRNNLEDATVRRLADSRSDKDQTIRLLSMGSGGLMSDFITLEKLALAGFTKITIDCVDPLLDFDAIERIRKFFAERSPVSVAIEGYKNIQDISVEKYDVLLAVDYDKLSHNFDNSLIDLVKAGRHLNKTGFLALGFSDEDTLSGAEMEPIVLTSGPSMVQRLAEDLSQNIIQKDHLSVALPGIIDYLMLYSLFLALEKSSKTYAKISVSLTDYKKKHLTEEYESFLQALFPNTQVEVCSQEPSKKYDILFTGSLEEEFRTKEYRARLNEGALTYILYPKKHMDRERERETVKLF